MRKILFTDLDGTLLNDDSLVVGDMKKALDEMTKAGHILVLSSGRPLESILEVKRNARIDYPGVYIIATNGTLIYDCDNKKTVRNLTVSFDDVAAVWKMAEECKMHIQTYSDTHIICAREDEEIKFYRRRIHMPLLLSGNPSSVLKKEPNKLLAIDLYDHERIAAFGRKVEERFSARLQTVFSNPYYLEIFAKEAGKGSSLRYLCEYLDIPVENSIGAGDAQNDISMLEAAGLAVAMCNGDESVKKSADVITKRTNHECGLADVIYEYIL